MPTTDIARTRERHERFGFTADVYGDFVMTQRDDIELFLSLKPDHDPGRTASCIYIRVTDADALHAVRDAAGTPGLKELHDTDYKMREFAYIDPDGNMLLFDSPQSAP